MSLIFLVLILGILSFFFFEHFSFLRCDLAALGVIFEVVDSATKRSR